MANKKQSQLYTLDEIATEICCKTSHCDDCPGKPYCTDGHDGVHEWLRKIMEEHAECPNVSQETMAAINAIGRNSHREG